MNDKVFKTLEFDRIIESVASLCTCELSKKYAYEIIPRSDPDEVEALLSETEDGVSCILKRGSPPSAGIRDLGGTLKRAETLSVLTGGELLSVAAMLTAVRRLKSYYGSDSRDGGVAGDEANAVGSRIGELTPVYSLEQNITRCVISEDEIADDASAALAGIRRDIFRLQGSIKDKLNELTHSQKYSKALQDSIVTVRSGRYCVPVKIENRADVPGIVHDTSSSGQTLFVEPAFVVESNNRIRELRSEEQEEIGRILKELSAGVAENSGILRNDLILVSELDLIFAKASYALSINAVKPLVGTDGVIMLNKARHPLLDKKKAVPGTITLGIGNADDRIPPSAMIITGPNTGGKTVTLKTAGLLHLMAQSGLLIPAAENSRINVFDEIFADIGDEQSIAQSLSTFSSHMKNITEIIKAAGPGSLILFDELGAGTDPTEGAALAMSILECVYQMGAVCLATTHYSELKVFASTTPGFINASCEFDIETLAPTYRLLIGVPGKSNAFAISEKLGLDPNVVSRAREFLSAEDLRFEEMLSGIEKNRTETEAALQESQRLLKEAAEAAAEARRERDELLRESAELKYKASVRAREADNKARAAAEKMLTEIRRAALTGGIEGVKAAEAAKREFEQTARELENDIGTAFSPDNGVDTGEIDTGALKPGDRIRIVSLNCSAVVLSPAKSDGSVYVQAGAVKLYAKKEDIRADHSSGAAGQKREKPDKREMREKAGNTQKKDNVVTSAANVRYEIDVRGMTVEEAEEYIERQINDAQLAGISSFRIIHGKGTGALRRGVQSFLKSHKSVASVRDGAFGEGDLGVTVATLK